MEKEILKTISKYHPYNYIDIKTLFDKVKSWDKLLYILKISSAFNININCLGSLITND